MCSFKKGSQDFSWLTTSWANNQSFHFVNRYFGGVLLCIFWGWGLPSDETLCFTESQGCRKVKGISHLGGWSNSFRSKKYSKTGFWILSGYPVQHISMLQKFLKVSSTDLIKCPSCLQESKFFFIIAFLFPCYSGE